MEKLKLENFGVQEMDAKEIKQIQGGIAPLVVWRLVGCAIVVTDVVAGIYYGYQAEKAADKKK